MVEVVPYPHVIASDSEEMRKNKLQPHSELFLGEFRMDYGVNVLLAPGKKIDVLHQRCLGSYWFALVSITMKF